jgi:CPA2 family monovalent cation:H+ antiporter-2
LFAALDRWFASREPRTAAGVTPAPPKETAARAPVPRTALTDHVVLIGHGRVGSFVTAGLPPDTAVLVIEHDPDRVAALKQTGHDAIAGNAADPEVVRAANLEAARCLLVAIPDAFEGGQVVEQAREINPDLTIIARAHSDEEIQHLKRHGATKVVMGEHEIGRAMIADIPPRHG